MFSNDVKNEHQTKFLLTRNGFCFLPSSSLAPGGPLRFRKPYSWDIDWKKKVGSRIFFVAAAAAAAEAAARSKKKKSRRVNGKLSELDEKL